MLRHHNMRVTGNATLRPDTRPPRAGYTLVEMLLVLSVLLALAFVSWPVMEGVYSDYQLRRAAEEMVAALAGARIRAIDAGTAYQFRYEPTGRRWFALPYERDDLSGNAADPATVSQNALSGEIPESMLFLSTNSSALVEQLDGDALSALPQAELWKNVAWSPPVIFFADGSALEAMFDLADERQNLYRISVRDLSGAARLEKQATQAASQFRAEAK